VIKIIKKIKIVFLFSTFLFSLGVFALTTSLIITLWLTVILIVIYVLTIFSFIYINKILRKTNWYKNQFIDIKKFVSGLEYRDDLQRNYEVVNVGSNPAKFAFFYQDVIGRNWSTGSQSLKSDFNILKYYHSYIKEGGTVIIPLVVFSSVFDDYLITAPSHYSKYYLILDKTLIDNYSLWFRLRHVTYPLLSNPLRALRALLKDDHEDKRMRIDVQLLDKYDLERDAQRWVNNWKEEFDINDLDAPITQSNLDRKIANVSLLSEVISFCLERNLKPVVVLPPVTRALSSKFSETFRENYIYSFIKEANINQVLFLNYFDDERFTEPNLYFNSFFLNLKGRKIFTSQVLSDLGII